LRPEEQRWVELREGRIAVVANYGFEIEALRLLLGSSISSREMIANDEQGQITIRRWSFKGTHRRINVDDKISPHCGGAGGR